jgi:hypothetical protein
MQGIITEGLVNKLRRRQNCYFMKALCIDTSDPIHPHLLKTEHYVMEGETYTVLGSYLNKSDGHEYYYPEEKQLEPVVSYRANRFIPLSDICEEDEYHVRMAMLREWEFEVVKGNG